MISCSEKCSEDHSNSKMEKCVRGLGAALHSQESSSGSLILSHLGRKMPLW